MQQTVETVAEVVDFAQTLPGPSQVMTQTSTPTRLLEIAVQRGATAEELGRLMLLQERYEANEARRAYNEAMALFKANPPEIFKDKHVYFTSQKGDTSYDHATLGNVCAQITKGLADVGITHSWRTSQVEGKVVVSCVLRHRAGHEEVTTLESSPDQSGGKNSIQAIGSAVSYLQRYTLLSATGLATKDLPQDDDGNGADATDVTPLLHGLHSTTSDAAAHAYWVANRDALRGDQPAYDAFKSAVVQHRNALRSQK